MPLVRSLLQNFVNSSRLFQTLSSLQANFLDNSILVFSALAGLSASRIEAHEILLTERNSAIDRLLA